MQQIGRYEILGEIGRGGMGVVYLGRDPAIGRQVAIKTIRIQDIGDPQEKEWLEQRLFREARSAGILSHPYIVTVHDVAQEGNLAYIVMEYVKGVTLEKVLSEETPPSQTFLLITLRQTAMALDYAHRNAIVHRDIKPSNILIHQDGIAKITDFGVAKILTTQQMTRSGSILGTPNYMSPEQFAGGAIDGRADQFSLAAIAYLMLAGETPYVADTLPALVYKIVHEDPPPPQSLNPTLAAAVEGVFRRALARKPEERYPSCAEFVEALEVALRGSPNWKAEPRRRPQPPRPVVRTPVSPGATGSSDVAETAGTAPVVCTSCNARLPWGSRFCLVCGTAVPASPTPAAAPAVRTPTPTPKAPEPRTPTPAPIGEPRTPTPSPVRKRLMTSPALEKELQEKVRGSQGRRRPPLAAVAAVLLVAVAGWVVYKMATSKETPAPQSEIARVAPAPATAPPVTSAPPPPLVPRPEPVKTEPAARTTTPVKTEPEPGTRRTPGVGEVAPPAKVVQPYRPPTPTSPAPASVEKTVVAPPVTQQAPPPVTKQAPAPVTQPPVAAQPAPQPQAPPEPVEKTTIPPAPVPVEPPKPTAGDVVWQGELDTGGILIINKGRYPTRGKLSGELPAVPLDLTVSPGTVKVQAQPQPGGVVLLNTGPRVAQIRIHWAAR